MYIKAITSHLARDQKYNKSSLHNDSANFRSKSSQKYVKLTKQTFQDFVVRTNNYTVHEQQTPSKDQYAQQLKYKLTKAKQEYNTKRELIKQKIKVRLKEQMASLLRRNLFHCRSAKGQESPKQIVDYSSSIVVKSKFSPVIKQLTYKSELIDNMNKNCKIGSVLLQQNPANIRIQNKRCWSSSLKQRPRQNIAKRSIHSRMSNVEIKIKKQQQILNIHAGNKIQPWINFQDDIYQL